MIALRSVPGWVFIGVVAPLAAFVISHIAHPRKKGPS